MSFAHQTLTGSKPEQYAQLADQARALLAGEPDRIVRSLCEIPTALESLGEEAASLLPPS